MTTTKRLILLRHGEAEMPSPIITDHQRKLTKLGIFEAQQTALRVQKWEWLPEAYFVSDAVRTLMTYKEVTQQIEGKHDMKQENSLFLATDMHLLQFIRSIPNSIRTACIIGHNPGLSNVIDYLSGRYTSLSTANAALLQFEVDGWELIGRGLGNLLQVVTPHG